MSVRIHLSFSALALSVSQSAVQPDVVNLLISLALAHRLGIQHISRLRVGLLTYEREIQTISEFLQLFSSQNAANSAKVYTGF